MCYPPMAHSGALESPEALAAQDSYTLVAYRNISPKREDVRTAFESIRHRRGREIVLRTSLLSNVRFYFLFLVRFSFDKLPALTQLLSISVQACPPPKPHLILL